MKLENTIHTDDLPQALLTTDDVATILGKSVKSIVDAAGRARKGQAPYWYVEPISTTPVGGGRGVKYYWTKEAAEEMLARISAKASDKAPADMPLFDDSLSGAPEENTKEKAPASDAGAIKKQSQFTVDYTRQQRYSTELDKATDALRFISPDLSREDWVRVAMALKSEFGEDGFPPFDVWSMGGKSYKANDAKDTWQSVDGSGGVKIGTLYHMAKQAGWGGTGVSTHSDIARDFQPINREPKSPNESQQQQSDTEKHAKAAEKARDLIAAATPVASENNHPYLLAKGVSVSGAVGLYVLPLPDF